MRGSNLPSVLDKSGKSIPLYDALNIGYKRDTKAHRKGLRQFGYVLDEELSDPRERAIAFNPKTKKIAFIENGTNPLSPSDVFTDIALGAGVLTATPRYQRAKDALLKAKEKYHADGRDFEFFGHSLGGGLVGNVAPKGAKVLTYNAAIGGEARHKRAASETTRHYRTAGDLVSILAPPERTTTLANTTGAVPARPLNYILKAHEVDSLPEEPIYF
jgi:hypothetical protein